MNWKEETGRRISEMFLKFQKPWILELDILVTPLKMNTCGSFYSYSTITVTCLERSAAEQRRSDSKQHMTAINTTFNQRENPFRFVTLKLNFPVWKRMFI